jgi:mannose-6-phosphate isomerase-like protein (cupin superfamily)
MDFDSVVVNKPWGYEYLMFENEDVGLWFLHLKAGASTSLHCHPRKKTGLVLMSGHAELAFLNSSSPLGPLSRVMIRPGLFHSTRATSPEGAALLEIETPRDKENLVRLEDAYGREEQPYEGPESASPLPGQFLRLSVPTDEKPRSFALEGCTITLHKTARPAELDLSDPGAVMLVLDGGLFTDTGEPVLTAGDVVSPATVARLAARFPAPRGMTVLTIRRP